MEKKEYKTFIGRLSMDIEALSKTPKGVYAAPTYRIDNQGNINNFFQHEGKPMELYDLRGGSEKIYEQKALVDEGKLRSLALALDNPLEDNISWISLQLWGDIAKEVHINYKKGDLVALVAVKNSNKSQATGKTFDIWNVVNIQKVEFEYVKKEDEPVVKSAEPKVTGEVSYGFKGIEEEDMDEVPF